MSLELKNIIIDLFRYVDSQLLEISELKLLKDIERRKENLHRQVVNTNTKLLVLFAGQNNCIDQIANNTRLLYNYINLKLDNFDSHIPIVINEQEFENENNAPITESTRILVKQIKSQLWVIQFDIVNQRYKIRLKINGNNVGLALDSAADPAFTTKVKEVFNDPRLKAFN